MNETLISVTNWKIMVGWLFLILVYGFVCASFFLSGHRTADRLAVLEVRITAVEAQIKEIQVTRTEVSLPEPSGLRRTSERRRPLISGSRPND